MHPRIQNTRDNTLPNGRHHPQLMQSGEISLFKAEWEPLEPKVEVQKSNTRASHLDLQANVMACYAELTDQEKQSFFRKMNLKDICNLHHPVTWVEIPTETTQIVQFCLLSAQKIIQERLLSQSEVSSPQFMKAVEACVNHAMLTGQYNCIIFRGSSSLSLDLLYEVIYLLEAQLAPAIDSIRYSGLSEIVVKLKSIPQF